MLRPRKKDETWIKNILEGDGLENSQFCCSAGNFTHKQFIQFHFIIAKQIKSNAMFGQFVVLGRGRCTRQGSEDLSEAALSVTEATKIGRSWGDLIAFLLEVLHFNILFF